MKFSEYFKQRTCDLIARTEERKLAEAQEYLKQIRSLRYQNGALNAADFFGGVYILFVMGILPVLLIAANLSGRQPEVLLGVTMVPALLGVWAAVCSGAAELVAALNRYKNKDDVLFRTAHMIADHVEESRKFYETAAADPEPESDIAEAVELYTLTFRRLGREQLAESPLFKEYMAAMKYRPTSIFDDLKSAK